MDEKSGANREYKKTREQIARNRPHKVFAYRRLSHQESEMADGFIRDADNRIRKQMYPVSRRLGQFSRFDQVCQFTLASLMYRDQFEPELNFDESLSDTLSRCETPGGWQFRKDFNSILSRHIYRFAQDEYDWYRSLKTGERSAKELRDGNVSTRTWIRRKTEAISNDYSESRQNAVDAARLRRVRLCLTEAVIDLRASSEIIGSIAEFLVYGAETHATCLLVDPKWSKRDNATIGNYCDIHGITRKAFAKLKSEALESIKSRYKKLEADYLDDPNT
ncbi:hypothetical protein [Roseiconus lacunae]|uniref:hypothetical protein n=1 Tax=Roseiconus lacunae TaxID=2605694 RepID=UPI001E306E10|nr:hypothetical protein [Roseiconus lacunae]MCD0462168.1 hypothetical protein [Roseiconus lacunae]